MAYNKKIDKLREKISKKHNLEFDGKKFYFLKCFPSSLEIKELRVRTIGKKGINNTKAFEVHFHTEFATPSGLVMPIVEYGIYQMELDSVIKLVEKNIDKKIKARKQEYKKQLLEELGTLKNKKQLLEELEELQGEIKEIWKDGK